MRQCAGLIGGWGLRALGLLYARGNRQQLSQLSDIVCAGAIGEEAVMADAVQALWQDVHQEPADELVGIERQRCVPAGPLDPVVLVAEGHTILAGCDQAAIGDRDTMGIARQVSQYLLWPAERLLGVDDPVGRGPRPQERGECLAVGEAGVIAE